MKKVLVADGSSVIRSIEKQIISNSKNLQFAGEACSFDEIKIAVKEKRCNSVVVDYRVISGNKFIASLNGVFEECKKLGVPVLLFVSDEFAMVNSPDGISLLVKPSFTTLNQKNIDTFTMTVETLLTNSRQDLLFKDSKIVTTKSEVVPELGLGKVEAIVIGVSTGGPIALQTLLKGLGTSCSVPVFITQHVDSIFDKKLIEWLDNSVALKVKLAEDMEEPLPNHVYFAPADRHLVFKKNFDNKVVISLNNDAPINFLKPSVDKMFESAAQVFCNCCIGVLLTGMGSDGARGCCLIKRKGGHVIAESEETCSVYGMPKAAVDAGGVSEKLPLYSIASRLNQLV